MKSLFLFAAATAAVLASAAFATPGPACSIARRAGDRLTILTGDQECKVPNAHAGTAAGGAEGDHAGQIGCLGRAPVGG